jgi:hypothetical protein
MHIGAFRELLLRQSKVLPRHTDRTAEADAGKSCCRWHGITFSILTTINLQTILYNNGRT